MKIKSVDILNFRGIREVAMRDLGTMVVIAGQNGSGKSCIFDAIRLLKSVYGGYQANEWHQWMGEFQINLAGPASNFLSIFNQRDRELRISANFSLHDEERSYIRANYEELLREFVIKSMFSEAYGWGRAHMSFHQLQLREREAEIAAAVSNKATQLFSELELEVVTGELSISPGEQPHIRDSVCLSLAFSSFRPQHLGVIDFHGAQRHYGREVVQGINLNLDSSETQRSHHALYNYANKYTNVKGEMAAAYVKEILAEQAGVPRASQATLTNTLRDLFETFFPDKRFLGPVPNVDGALTFPVVTPGGGTHDLDDLSSGEKEILYGYLRIRNSAPKHSIILLDEPELHLNPRLIRGLPQFYRKKLGEELSNQIWLVTHSDALLREVVGHESYNVFHMISQGSVQRGDSQLKPMTAANDLEMALADLVGDLAAYRPGGTLVLLEGGGDSEFDKRVVAQLFPEIVSKANLISGTNKAKVRALHDTLESLAASGGLPLECFSIVDRDSDVDLPTTSGPRRLRWDVYHIENYLLDPEFIAQVVAAANGEERRTASQVFSELENCARSTLSSLVHHQLVSSINSELVPCIRIGADPRSPDLANALVASIDSSLARLAEKRGREFSSSALGERESQLRSALEEDLRTGNWAKTFRGRDILKRYIGDHVRGVNYEAFRNMLLERMRDAGHKPLGMSHVLAEIIPSERASSTQQ